MICAKCCMDLTIDPMHLLFPAQLSEDGLEFVRAHGLDFVPLGRLRDGAVAQPNGWVKILHRCRQLTPDNRCQIYAKRPKICREFDCSTRNDHVDIATIEATTAIIRLKVVH